MSLKKMDRSFTVVVDKPLVLDDVQGFIESFYRIDFDASDVGRKH
jgi:hypothetical protein